ncbi:MAG: hypothetical protein ACOX3T_05505 [Bdellovibrionota bacterium]
MSKVVANKEADWRKCIYVKGHGVLTISPEELEEAGLTIREGKICKNAKGGKIPYKYEGLLGCEARVFKTKEEYLDALDREMRRGVRHGMSQ